MNDPTPISGVFYLRAPPPDLRTLGNLFKSMTPYFYLLSISQKKFLENFVEYTIFVKKYII